MPYPKQMLQCDQTGEIFDSVTDAIKLMDIVPSCMYKHMRGELNSTHGFSFTKLASRDEATDIRKPYLVSNSHKAVMCIQTHKRYLSLADAAREIGLDRSSISKHLRGRQRSVKGYTFRYV